MNIDRKIASLLSVYIIIGFFSNLFMFLFLKGTLSIPPSYWLIALYASLIFIIFLNPNALFYKRNFLLLWAIVYIAISLLWSFGSSFSSEIIQIIINNFQSILFLLSSTLLLTTSYKVLNVARWGIVYVTIIGAFFNIYEVFNPLTFSFVSGRSAGLYINPNSAGISMVLGLLLGIGVLSEKWRPLFCIITLLGVLTTFSRSAIIIYLIVILSLIITKKISFVNKKGILILFILIFMVLNLDWYKLNDILQDNLFSNSDILLRTKFLLNDASAESRFSIINEALKVYFNSPIIGHGLGTSKLWEFSISSHNIYLNLLVDYGIIGLLIIPGLLLSIKFRDGLFYIYSMVIILWGFVNHNILEEYHVLYSIAVMNAIRKFHVEQEKENKLKGEKK